MREPGNPDIAPPDPDLTPLDVDCMLLDKRRQGLSAQSVAHIRTVLRTALSYAEREGLVARDVAKLSEPVPTKEYEALYLTLAEARAFLEEFDRPLQ